MLSAFKVVAAFDEIIERAERVIVIVTPYFDPWPHLAQALFQNLDRRVAVHILLRGGEDRAKGEAAAQPFAQRGARVQFLDRLHAKVYLSEKQALLTSMNLIKASRDSWEVGTLFDATEDAASYQQIATMTGGLFDTVNIPVAAERPAQRTASTHPTPPTRVPVRQTVETRRSHAGHCIRCSEAVAVNQAKPLCRDCHASWAEYKNADYQEKFCHLCGCRAATSVAKPLCRSCWDKSA